MFDCGQNPEANIPRLELVIPVDTRQLDGVRHRSWRLDGKPEAVLRKIRQGGRVMVMAWAQMQVKPTGGPVLDVVKYQGDEKKTVGLLTITEMMFRVLKENGN